MTKTFKRIIITAVTLIAVAALAVALVVTGGCSATLGDPLADMRNGALNAVLDASGVKDKIDSELRSKATEIADQYGIPEALVDVAVDSLDVKDWQVTSLPEDASEEATFSVNLDGVDAQITTYDDPGVVTVKVYGQSATMAVPESAQAYTAYIQYLQYLQ